MHILQNVTTLRVVNIHHSYIFSPLAILFKLYSLNFQIYGTVLLTIVTMLYLTSPELIYIKTGSFYLLISFTQFSHPSPSTSKHHKSDLYFL